MKQFMSGTSAIESAQAACWGLYRTGGADEIASYELRPQGEADAQAPEVMLQVIRGLLDGMHVGVIAESGEAGMPALNRLGSIWRDGRMLKRSEGGAFVALENRFDGLTSEGIEPCVGAGTAFRFIGFDGHVPEDTVFRSLVDQSANGMIELSCHDFADGVLSIRFDAEKVDETETLGDISRAVSGCGCFLQVDM